MEKEDQELDKSCQKKEGLHLPSDNSIRRTKGKGVRGNPGRGARTSIPRLGEKVVVDYLVILAQTCTMCQEGKNDEGGGGEGQKGTRGQNQGAA